MRGFFERMRRAFAEFLTIPTLLILGFLGLAGLAFHLDRLRDEGNLPWIVTTSHESVTTLLGTIAASIVTVTSITFSLLLIAVQQSAAALTGQVYDQFLRRRSNQVYFGYFIGLALYCLVILATVERDYAPVYGALIAFVLMVVALFMLALLIYASIDQMRPVNIIRGIRDHALSAREGQADLLAATVDRPSLEAGELRPLFAKECGYLTKVDFDELDKRSRECAGISEIVIRKCLGDYVSIGEVLMEVRCSGPVPDAVEGKLEAALRLENQRDLETDPGFGIEQMANIAWTTVSTSKQNPEPGKLVCRALRDLFAHWYIVGEGVERGGADCRIVLRDRVPADLVRGFETLAVVASESMQHHTLAEVYQSWALVLKRGPAPLREQVEAALLRSLAVLGDHALTAELDDSIEAMLDALPAGATRAAVLAARDQLSATRGKLNSRATRVKA